MYRTLIFIVILVFGAFGSAFAVPVESPPEQGQPSVDLAAASDAKAMAPPKIPDSTTEMFIREGQNSRFEIYFLDTGNKYDVVDYQFYKAWCLEEGKPIRRNAIHKVRIYNCYDTSCPPKFSNMEWNKINYIINHKNASAKDTQQAIWYFAGSRKKPLTEEAAKIVEEANIKGKDYKPGDGELIAVVVDPGENKQAVFMEHKLSSPKVALLPIVPMPIGGPVAPPIIPPIPPPGPPPGPPPAPEPSSVLLLGCGLAGIFAYQMRKKRDR